MFLNRPITAFILILASFIFGGLALNELSVDLLPDVDSPSLVVRTDWQGASPREVETLINERLEAVLSTIPGIEDVHGFARQGQSIIYLSFQWGHNMDLAFLNVREKLDQVQYFMPEQAGRPQLIFNTTADEPIAVLAITSNTRPNNLFETRLALKRWADQVLSRRLEQAEGVAQAVLVGAVEPEVQIRYLPREIDRFNLSLSDIQGRVMSANIFASSGELREGWYRYSMKIESRIQSLEDLENVPVARLGSGRILSLGEISEIELSETDPTSFALLDGESVLNMLVKKEFGSNTVEVFDTMMPLVEEMGLLYPDISIEVLREDATFIRNSIQDLLQTLLIGGLLSFIVLFTFLNDVRTPFTIGIAIPVSIFITFFVMFVSDIQLNIISLSGLTLGIGLLVDNAVIVLENINRHRSLTPSIRQAADKGTKEIMLAVAASTFTTISVFLPLIFLGGFEGAFFRDQAYTLSISLLASLFVALIILPVLVVQLLEKKELGKSFGTGQLEGRPFFNKMLERYEQSLEHVLKKPFPLLLTALFLCGFAFYAFLVVPKSMLPEDEPSEVTYRAQLPGNTSLFSTQQAADALHHRIKNAGLGGGRIQIEGGYTDQTNLANLAREGLNRFTITIPVNGYEEAGVAANIIQQFDDDFEGWVAEPVSATQSWSALIGADQPPVLFRIIGRDRNASEQMAEILQERFSDSGLNINLKKQFDQEVDTWNIRFRTSRMLQLGISEQEVIHYLESITRGSFVTDWNREDERIGIRLVGGHRGIYTPEDVSLRLDGREIPLSYISYLERDSEPEQLERTNQTPVLSYVADWDVTDWWWHSGRTESLLQDFVRSTGTEVQVAGNAKMVQQLMTDMGILLALSILIIYIILAIQFENLKYPFLIILAIPFAWIGSLLMMWVTGTGLNALSFMGILILTGIAVNDSILKVDFMRRYHMETGNLQDAILQSGKHRFRPVLMTSATTILGLMPMLIPFGDGYAFRQALSIALIGGMMSSTILTLYLIPVIFGFVEGMKKNRRT